jgi:hypothetical protein
MAPRDGSFECAVALRPHAQEPLKRLDQYHAARVVELLEVVGEIGEADLVLRVRERYLSAQPVVTERVFGEERAAFGGEHEAGAPA